MQRLERSQPCRGATRPDLRQGQSPQAGLEGRPSALPQARGWSSGVRSGNQAQAHRTAPEAGQKSVPSSGFHAV